MAQPSRPLSPHLTVYKLEITMLMSFAQRISGVALYLGLALLTWWLVAAASSAAALDVVNAVMGHWLGQVLLFLFTWALFHHMLGGIRHLVWDMGKGFSRASRFGTAWATLIGGFVLAALVWAFVIFG